VRGELPEGWTSSGLGDLFDFKYGKGLPQEKRLDRGSVKVYGSNGVVGVHDKAITEGPTIIVGRKGSVGEVHLSPEACWPIDTTYFIDEFPVNLPPNYWALYLRSLGLGQQEKSSAIPGISRNDVYAVEVPVPPLAEQRRIVGKLEELLGKVDACRKRLDRVPLLLKRFRQSVLSAACSGRLTADWRSESTTANGQSVYDSAPELPEIPDRWRWVRLPETGEMSRGKSRHRPRNEPSLFGGPYPFIQTGDIAQSGGRITSHKQAYSNEGLAQSRLWPTGTICITIAANIAESAMLTYPACFPDSVVGIIADPELSVAEYVEYFIRVAKTDLAMFAPATAQKNINIAILGEVSVPLPPVAEQREIVRRVEGMFALADQIEARYLRAHAQVDRFTPSLLARAFHGDLVPTEAELARAEGRGYEPAAVLLERIRAGAPSARPMSDEGRRSPRPRPRASQRG
jgi:type I restriction enzyme S subunit